MHGEAHTFHAADVARHHLAGGDADAGGQPVAGKHLLLRHPFDAAGGAQRPVGMVRLVQRHVEHRQHGVPLELGDDAVLGAYGLFQGGKVGVQHVHHGLRVRGLDHRGETLDVGIENGGGALHGLQHALIGDDGLGHGLGHEFAEGALDEIALPPRRQGTSEKAARAIGTDGGNHAGSDDDGDAQHIGADLEQRMFVQ